MTPPPLDRFQKFIRFGSATLPLDWLDWLGHWWSLEVDSDQSRAYLDDKRGFVGWDGWMDWMVILGRR